MSGGITCEVRRLNISHMILKIVYLCLSEKTLKAVGSIYLVSMSGEVKDPDQVSFKAHLWKRTLTRTRTLGRYVTISRAHSAAVSVITRFAGRSCCGRARRSPALECVLKALCSRVGVLPNTDDVVQSFINSLVHKFLFCCH